MKLSTMRLTILCLFIAGCAASEIKLSKVSGSVFYKNQPVSGAIVIFAREGVSRVATGTTNESGEFQLTTLSTGDGAPVGECVVTITKLAADEGQAKEMKPEDYAKQMQSKPLPKTKAAGGTMTPVNTKSALPAKYSDPSKSNLKRTVADDGTPNVFRFDLTD